MHGRASAVHISRHGEQEGADVHRCMHRQHGVGGVTLTGSWFPQLLWMLFLEFPGSGFRSGHWTKTKRGEERGGGEMIWQGAKSSCHRATCFEAQALDVITKMQQGNFRARQIIGKIEVVPQRPLTPQTTIICLCLSHSVHVSTASCYSTVHF